MDLTDDSPIQGREGWTRTLTGGNRVLLDTLSPFINVPGNGHSVRTTKQQRHKRIQLKLTTDDFGHP